MTLIEGLNCLPEPYRLQACNNTNPIKYNWEYKKITSCLETAFDWSLSRERAAHWLHMHLYLRLISEKEGIFFVNANNQLQRFLPGYYNPDHSKIIFKIRIKRK
jgi:hypothetical protein